MKYRKEINVCHGLIKFIYPCVIATFIYSPTFIQINLLLSLNRSDIKKYIIFGLGFIAFIIGNILINLTVWLVLLTNSPDIPLLPIHNWVMVEIIGLALIAVGLIVIRLTKRGSQ